ncbi:MAG TPA: TadE family protein [Dehalococcoidia bacterium]|nr:TadE family protein [Dehalococcoidia bacterium]
MLWPTARWRPPSRRAGRALREGGQAMVEFSLVITLMLVLIFGLIDFGRAYICYVEVSNAAREGARLGVTHATTSAIQAQAKSTAGPFGDANFSANVSYVTSPGLDSQVQVDTSYNLSFITPLGGLVKLLTGGTIATGPWVISSTSRMHME